MVLFITDVKLLPVITETIHYDTALVEPHQVLLNFVWALSVVMNNHVLVVFVSVLVSLFYYVSGYFAYVL